MDVEKIKLKNGTVLDVADTEAREDIGELNSNLTNKIFYPNYYGRSIIHEDSTGGYDDVTYTGSFNNDGYVQAHVTCTSSTGSPFIRIVLNNVVVYEYQVKRPDVYVYAWSPLFPVKAGDTYRIQLGANATTGSDFVKQVFFYSQRS